MMTIWCAKTDKIILQPTAMMSIAEATLPESDDEWMDIARKRISKDVLFGEREKFMLSQCRQMLKNAPPAPPVGKREAVFKLYRRGGL